MDIEKMKALTQGIKDIRTGAKGGTSEDAMASYGAEALKYFNKGINSLDNNNPTDALNYFFKASDTIPMALFYIGYIYGNAGDADRMIKYMTQAANAGIIDSMIILSDIYFNGEYVPLDGNQAFKWAKKAANTRPTPENHVNDDAPIKAMCNLGIYYLTGVGTQENPAEAFALLKKASEEGNVDAMFWVGQMYRKGIGVIQSIPTAGTWLKRSADGGNTDAMIAYGDFLEECAKKGISWESLFDHVDKFDKKTKENPLNALFNSALTTIGAAIFLPAEYYKKAGDARNPEGYLHLALFYVNQFSNNDKKSEEYKAQDRLKASEAALKGAEAGNVDCMYLLGCIWEGIYNTMDNSNQKYYAKSLNGIPGDTAELKAANYALHFYDLAAQNGHEEAKKSYDTFLQSCQNKSKGGCFITTAVCESFGKVDDCYELTAFRNFRDNWLALQSDGKNLIAEYYNIAPRIVEKINGLKNSAQIYKNIWVKYLAPCLSLIENGDNQSCKKIYVEMVNTLKKKFL